MLKVINRAGSGSGEEGVPAAAAKPGKNCLCRSGEVSEREAIALLFLFALNEIKSRVDQL